MNSCVDQCLDIETRYPGDFPEGFSWKDADDAFNSAERIKEFVLKKLRTKNEPPQKMRHEV